MSKEKKATSRKFQNIKTGEAIRYDYGDPQSMWVEKDDHYHKYNPNAPKGRIGDLVRFLDCKGKTGTSRT